MSEANRVRVALIEESVWGTTPGSGNLYVIPHTGVSGNPVFDTTESSTVRDDRQLRDIIKTMEHAEGSIDFEWNLADEGFNLILEGLAFADRGTATAVTAAVNISINGTGGVITAASGTPFVNLVVGQRVRLSGFANNNNNGIFLITAKNSSAEIACASQGLATESAGASVNVQGQRLVFPGLGDKSYTIEFAVQDLGIYWKLTGCKMTSCDFNISVSDLITGSLSFQAKNWTSLSGTSLDATLTLVDALTADEALLMTGCSSIALLREDEADFSAQRNIQSLDFTIDNGLEPRYGVAKGRFPGKIRKNTCRVTGSFTEDFYTEDIVTRSDGAQFTPRSLGFAVFGGYESDSFKESGVYALYVHFPLIKFTEPDVNLAGLDEEAEGSNSFTSVASTDGTLIIDFFPMIP